MSYAELFRQAPPKSGLPGDLLLWDALGWHLSNKRAKAEALEAPLNLSTVGDEIASGFFELTNVALDDEATTTVQVDWLPQEGMSGRSFCSTTWRDTLVPELLSRAENLGRKPTRHLEYHPAEHRFRFAAWCAATASRSSRSVCTFPVKDGAHLLRESSLRWLALGPHWIPVAEHFDSTHDQWCAELVLEGKKSVSLEGFSYGIAAKMVNCYTKALFLSDMVGGPFKPNEPMLDGDEYRDRVNALHPPVDRVLLKDLAKKNVGGLGPDWRRLMNAGWSKFNKKHYQEAITLMKQVSNSHPAKVEAYWVGYQ